MTLHNLKRIVIGVVLIAVGIAIGAYRATVSTRLISDVSLERETSTDFGVGFGPEVEERVVRVDLRIPGSAVHGASRPCHSIGQQLSVAGLDAKSDYTNARIIR
jgi:hypothetical protein